LGDSVVLVAQGGPPDAEYALFDPGEIELLATEPGRIREIGYRSTVAHARARLAESGITPEAAQEAAAIVRPALARAYARGAAVRRVVDRLSAAELFDGRTFDATSGHYAGGWLDLDTLVRDLALARAPAHLQALHLAALLAERDDDTPLVLATAQVSAARKPGERTFRRVSFEEPRQLAAALRALKISGEREGSEDGPSRLEILGWVRDRAHLAPATRERFASIEAALEARDAPMRGPLADGELWTLETKLNAGEVAGVAERLDDFERRRGRLPGTMYLRSRLALMTGAEDPRVIAERASSLSTSMSAFHELELLAAQAWVAAGDARRARAFARDLLDNKTASDALRMSALEVMDAVGQSSTNLEKAAAPTSPQPIVSVQPPPSPAPATGAGDAPTVPRERTSSPHLAGDRPPSTPHTPRSPAPSGSDFTPIPSSEPASTPRSLLRRSWPTIRAGDLRAEEREARGGAGKKRSLPPGASLPPYRIEPRTDGEPWTAAPAAMPDANAEIDRLETLSVPAELRGAAPPTSDAPRTPPEARLSCTYLARELAHDLRVRHGVELRCDLESLEIAQRYLREALPDGRVRSAEDEREILRSAAFLAELLARRLGARWVDLRSPEPGEWSMLAPCRSRPTEVVRVWPIARVLRFVSMGHKERDLVSYYLELETRVR
jgi:hypothetical protein